MVMEEMVRMSKLIALKQGHHMPMLFLDGTIARAPMILMEIPAEHEDRVKYMFLAGKKFSGKDEIGKLNKVFMIMEAWMGTNVNIRPSRDPKRIEVLIIACLDILTNQQTVTSLEYVRDASGTLADIKDYPMPDGVTAESPLLPAFVAGYNGQ